MLQHNNNNNYPCLDMAHRELLHGCRRGGATFSSALGFSAIPLIKGLRAWAVSGTYSRSRRKASSLCQPSDPAPESRTGGDPRKSRNVVGSSRVWQGGSGALVTVATLKDSEGGRQTQTRCLFLRADGSNYVGTVGTSGRGSGKTSQEGVPVGDVKPQARKWRKSGRPKSAEARQSHDGGAHVDCSGPTNSRDDLISSPKRQDVSTSDIAPDVDPSQIKIVKSKSDFLENKFGTLKGKTHALGSLEALDDAKRDVTTLAISRSHSETLDGIKSLGDPSDGDLDGSVLKLESKYTKNRTGSFFEDLQDLKVRTDKDDPRSFQHEEEIKEGLKIFEDARTETFADSPSQGSGSSAAETNPANTIREEEEGLELRRLALTPDSELLEKGGKVADGGTEALDEDKDDDEFGVFMKAGEEQVWNEGLIQLQKVPCEKQHEIDSNRASSWTSDWPGDLSVNQSNDTWTAFKQEVDRGTGKEAWFNNTVQNHQLGNLPGVFADAFPCLNSSFRDSDYVPTLNELLRGSEQNDKNRTQSLLDGLQDLDRMIGVKYKGAESLSHKLLLQSLNLSIMKSDRVAVCGRKPNSARFSPNLPPSNQQLAANAKRRLSYDVNRNVTA